MQRAQRKRREDIGEFVLGFLCAYLCALCVSALNRHSRSPYTISPISSAGCSTAAKYSMSGSSSVHTVSSAIFS